MSVEIAIGADHAAFELKELLKAYLTDLHYQVKDFGCHGLDSVDYPLIAAPLAEHVSGKPKSRGILLCGSGIGMSIAANRVHGVRAALCHNEEYAALSRKHNDSNVLVLGARFVNEVEAKSILKIWLNTEFEGGRHQRRVDLLD
jgi:ribose 5-phosphate isomerase B